MIICEFEAKQQNCAILLFNKKLIDIYYYNTYENHQISAVDMHAEDLESNKLICYPVIQGERINYQNKQYFEYRADVERRGGIHMKQDTLEGKAKTKNGIKRLCFSIICIFLEVIFIIAIVMRLNEYAEIINLFTRILSGILVLRLYASDKTSSMKMPWVILIQIGRAHV